MANSSGLIVYDGGPSSTMAYATALYFTLSYHSQCTSSAPRYLPHRTPVRTWDIIRPNPNVLLNPNPKLNTNHNP